MKNLLLTLLGILTLASCSKDDPYPCDNSTLATTIIGPWTASALGTGGSVEFLADGTLLDPDDAISGGSINDIPLTEKSYVIIGDTILEIESAAVGGSPSFSFEYPVIDYTCDEINLDVFGIPAKLKR